MKNQFRFLKGKNVVASIGSSQLCEGKHCGIIDDININNIVPNEKMEIIFSFYLNCKGVAQSIEQTYAYIKGGNNFHFFNILNSLYEFSIPNEIELDALIGTAVIVELRQSYDGSKLDVVSCCPIEDCPTENQIFNDDKYKTGDGFNVLRQFS